MASASVAKTPAPPPADFKNDPLLAGEHTLPASWWTSEKIYDLEKRAIFNQSWLFCTHSSRFAKAGDYFSYTIAGINFFIIKSKVDGSLKAFHNVCRHRAYPVIRKEEGSSIVVGCKYHGWSYNTDGKLTKAPHFDNVEGFDKDENSLYPVKLHVTPQGLVFVNFSNEPDCVEFDDWYQGLSAEMEEFDFSDYEYHMSYELDGQFNWKTLMDGYQECYHCPTAHPGLSTAFKMETYQVIPKGRYCRHYAEIVREKVEIPEDDKDADEESSWFGLGKKKKVEKPVEKPVEKKVNPGGDFNGLWVYLFPNSGVNCYSPAWYSIRVLPITATHTILHYDIYTKKGLPETEKKEFVDFLQLVELEDFNLCQLTQKNLNEGIYSTGYLHPNKERGVVFYQNLVADMVKTHFAKEQAAGKPINPAFVGHAAKNPNVMELEGICSTLECGSGSGEKTLDW
ncbi:ISP domain-containing protein [Scheffersomyces coipomensis]|uniref:ISP domain-containing protein n=1 Tax=Scheffersomyces coipomensis TaxID=1788519 RepID=UPI00315C6D5D